MAASTALILTVSLDWPFALVAALGVAIGATSIGWNGVFLAETARQSPEGKVSEATGGVMVITFLGSVIGPPMLSGLLAVTDLLSGWFLGAYGCGFGYGRGVLPTATQAKTLSTTSSLNLFQGPCPESQPQSSRPCRSVSGMDPGSSPGQGELNEIGGGDSKPRAASLRQQQHRQPLAHLRANRRASAIGAVHHHASAAGDAVGSHGTLRVLWFSEELPTLISREPIRTLPGQKLSAR